MALWETAQTLSGNSVEQLLKGFACSLLKLLFFLPLSDDSFIRKTNN